MAGSGGSLDDHEIDFDRDGRRNGFSSASLVSSQGSDDIYDGEVFSPEPQGEDVYSMTESIEEDIRPQSECQEADEDGDIGPLTPRGKIIGNGFERPIHRQSLQEFENLEKILKEQSQDSVEGIAMDERFLLGNGDIASNGGVNGGYEMGQRSSRDMDLRSDCDDDLSRSGRHNGFSDGEHSYGDAAEVGEGNTHNGSDDMMKYMQATPRSAQEFPSGGEHGRSRLMENSYDNDSLDDYRGEINGHRVPQMSSQQDFFSLSQEQLPDGPSHLESEDGSDTFANSGNNTLKGRESLSTVIQAAAANVETFGTGDSPEGKKDSSGGDVEHFKPIATFHRRSSRPQTAAQLKNKTISVQSSASEQISQQSIDSRRRNVSVTSLRTRSSRASTPQSVLSQSSRRSSRVSLRSHDDQSEYSIQESIGQTTSRSSTPGHDSTLIRQKEVFTPSPVKHDGKSSAETVPRLRLDNMSGRSEQSSVVSDIQLLDKSARSRLVSDEFVDQLQKEYDELLQKHAQAENTIDSLRLGARVNLHYEGAPCGRPGNTGMSPAKHSQNMALPQGQKGVVSSSRSGLPNTPRGNSTIHIHTSSNVSMGASTSSKGDNQMPPPDASEGKLLALQFQTQGHKEKMDSYEILLRENHLNPADQQRGLEGLKSGQAKLEADYMQAKEEHTMKARMGSVRGQQATFDPERSVDGQLFQLGMRLEDLQEVVQDNLRSNPPELPPTPQRKASDATMATKSGDTHGVDPTRGRGNTQSPDEDYALLLGRYDALKQLPPHPERDREIQQLVKSLQDMPDFALESLDQPDIGDEARFHGNDAEMMEDEIDFIGDGEDHDGDVDGSSSHSSPFRETTSPDVFRPKGTRQDELPKWQPPQDGSISSLGSPDHDPQSSSAHSRRKSIPGKSSAKQTPPRPSTGHRTSHPRGDAGGDTRKQRGNIKSTVGNHLEPEGDSGFLGSESSRQSLQTRGSDTRTRNRAQRLPPHSEIPKTAPSRDSRIPLYQSQKESIKTPLRNNEPVPLRQQAVPEEEDSIYSGGGKRARERKSEGTPYEPPDSAYSGGSKRSKERRPQKTTTSREQQRRDPKSVINQPRVAPSPIKQREQRAYAPPPPAQQSRHSSNDQSIPLGSQYLSRSANHQNNRAAAPQRVDNQRTEPPRRARESPPRQPDFDGRSDVTRSSVRSDALRALQDEVNQLRGKMAEARRNPNPPPIPEESRYSRMRNHDDADEDRLSTRSSKSEMLHMLQEEIADLKDQVADRDTAPSRMQAPYASSTPLRDTIRDVLRDRYIPRGNASSFNASPIRTSPTKYNSGMRHRSTMRSPPRPPTDNLSWSRGAEFTPSSPPAMSRRSGSFQTHGVGYQTGAMPCPMCGGSGSHTHGEYSYPPPPPPNPAPPPETYFPAYSSPALQRVYPQTLAYPQAQPSPAFAPHTMAATPQNNPLAPLIQGQSYVLQQPYPAMTPQHITVVPQATQQVPGTIPSAAPAAPAVNQTRTHQSSGTPSHLHPDARQVYLIPGKSQGRYYIRDNDDGSSAVEEEEELYYRRTPRTSRNSSRHTPRTAKHHKVSEVPAELQLSLDNALHMAQRLKRTTHQMVSSVRKDVRLAESFNG